MPTEPAPIASQRDPAASVGRITGRLFGRRRTRAALSWTIGIGVPPALVLVATTVREHVALGSVLMVELCVVMTAAALGGVRPGIVASLIASGLTNWFLTPPLHQFAIHDTQNVVALTVFLAVTVLVSVLVDRAARQAQAAAAARSEAAALARAAATLGASDDPVPDLLEQVRGMFRLRSAAVFRQVGGQWGLAHLAGSEPQLDGEDAMSIDLLPRDDLRLVIAGNDVGPEQVSILRAFADQLAAASATSELRRDAARLAVVAEADAMRTALLQTVSHDFRTPLATIKASASGLLEPDAVFSDDDRSGLITEIDIAADRLDRMVRDLLDMSRLQAGAFHLALAPEALEDVVAAALAGLPQAATRVDVDVDDALPLVQTDAALLERALANLVSNALAWSPPGRRVHVAASLVDDRCIDLAVIDHGPGVPLDARDRMFVPFQRLGDRSTEAGVGLGLAIAKGLVEIMGAGLAVSDTVGGGLTMTIRLPIEDGTLP